MSISPGFSTEQIREFVHRYEIQPYGQKAFWGLDPGSWTRCHFGYAASVRVADLAAA